MMTKSDYAYAINIRLNSHSYTASRLKCLRSIVAVLIFLFLLQMFSRQDYRMDSLYVTAWIFNCNVNIFNWVLIDWTTGDRVDNKQPFKWPHKPFFSLLSTFSICELWNKKPVKNPFQLFVLIIERFKGN